MHQVEDAALELSQDNIPAVEKSKEVRNAPP